MALPLRLVSNTITRPNDTTAYQDTDLVANDTTGANVTPFTWDFTSVVAGSRIVQAIIRKSTTTTANGSFRLWLFSESKAVTNGDNAAIAPTTMNGFLGTLSGTATLAGTAGARTPLAVDVVGQLWPVVGKIYGLLEAKAAYAPGAQETFSIELVTTVESR